MKFRILPFTRDLRSPELKARGNQLQQAIADAKLELEWQRRVQVNILRRQMGTESIFKARQAQ